MDSINVAQARLSLVMIFSLSLFYFHFEHCFIASVRYELLFLDSKTYF